MSRGVGVGVDRKMRQVLIGPTVVPEFGDLVADGLAHRVDRGVAAPGGRVVRTSMR